MCRSTEKRKLRDLKGLMIEYKAAGEQISPSNTTTNPKIHFTEIIFKKTKILNFGPLIQIYREGETFTFSRSSVRSRIHYSTDYVVKPLQGSKKRDFSGQQLHSIPFKICGIKISPQQAITAGGSFEISL